MNRSLSFLLMLSLTFVPFSLWAEAQKEKALQEAQDTEQIEETLEENQVGVSQAMLERAQEVHQLFESAKKLTGDNLTIARVSWYDKNEQLRTNLESQITTFLRKMHIEKEKLAKEAALESKNNQNESQVEQIQSSKDLLAPKASKNPPQSIKDKLTNTQSNLEQAKYDLTLLVQQQIDYANSALDTTEKEINSADEKIETATKEQRLLLQIDLNELRNFQVQLFKQQYQNLIWLENINSKSESAKIKALIQEISQVAKFTAATLHYSHIRQQMLQKEIDNLPPDQLGQFQLDLIYRQRNLDAASKRLKSLIELGDKVGLNTVELKNQLFNATGQISHELLNWQVFKFSSLDYLRAARNWIFNNVPNILFNICIFFIILLMTRYIARLVTVAVTNMGKSSNLKLSHLMQEFLSSMSGRIVYFLGLLFALGQVGLDLTPVLAGFGVAGIIIGFALQDTLSNFASGMMLLIYRPFDVGDWVFAAGVEGKVGKVSLVNTTIRTFDNEVLLIPNSKIWGDVIVNRTFERLRRVDMVFSIGYKDSIPHAEEILRQVVEADPRVLKTPTYQIGVDSLGDNSVNFILRPWVRTDDFVDVGRDMMREVKLKFDEAGINIPYPQRDVHVHFSDEAKSVLERQQHKTKEQN